ncbi:hypothetical protein MMC10_001487 [Thelotrema lepadinum]|nr:hypothetical protein [Thelotrema lepadinum]
MTKTRDMELTSAIVLIRVNDRVHPGKGDKDLKNVRAASDTIDHNAKRRQRGYRLTSALDIGDPEPKRCDHGRALVGQF